MKQRTDRLNSLLKEVIAEVIKRQVKNPHVSELVTVTGVDITKDLRHAKVFFSVIGDQTAKLDTLQALEEAAGFIAHAASKKVVLRYFPTLHFKLDEGVSRHMRIEELLHNIENERSQRVDDEEEHDGTLDA